jgi:CBS domain-containing protein/anti-sigma regulatory factor (Ser/Thr protein kinase)
MSSVLPKISDAQAENITKTEELAYELRIEEVMTDRVTCLSPDTIIREALDIFRNEKISGAPVIDGDTLVGILSIEDLIRSLREGRIDLKVSEYMTKEIHVIKTFDPVVEALTVFVKTGVGRLPVVNQEGKLVGILTKGDITDGLLHALQKEYHAEEIIRYRASHLFEDIHSDRTSLILRYNIKKGDFTLGGAASNHIKRALLRLGASPQIARRCGIAVYESEMNLIIHTNNGGTLRVEIEPHKITMEAYDDGPGIEDIEKALQPGFSTATEEVREMGFGAGMGLVNIKRCVNEMKLFSSKEGGTQLFMVMHLTEADKTNTELSRKRS